MDEIYQIREWAPCTNIVEQVPLRPPRGGLSVFIKELNITCISAVDNFLALGTDCGVVYWYDRKNDDMQRLDTENANANIVCLSIVDSVEFMLAAGDTSGKVHVFQIHKKLPPDLQLITPKKTMQRYTVRDMHHARITCCEWSRNGMKLFSGNQMGVVVLTEFDYTKHQSRSIEILSEAYEIVQLSAYRQYLLVSTLYRSAICNYSTATGKWELWQVGKKDRKQLEDCGGIFLPCAFGPPRVLCGRPRQRFWISDLQGNVERTLLFKDALNMGANWEIPLLSPKQQTQELISTENFRQVKIFDIEKMLFVSHDGNKLYILNLENLCVEAIARGFRAILDFCVHNKEIFVLEGARSLIRLAAKPEQPNRSSRIVFNPIMPPLLPALGVIAADVVENASEYVEEANISGAEECIELPPIAELDLNIPIALAVESPRSNHTRRFEIFKQISNDESDSPILHAHTASTTETLQQQVIEDAGSINKEVEKTASGSSGIVEIGRIALYNNEIIEEKPNNSLMQICTEFLPELLEPIAMGVPSATSISVEDTILPKEFCESRVDIKKELENIYPQTCLPNEEEEIEKTVVDNAVCNQLGSTPLQQSIMADGKESDIEIDSFLFDFKRAPDPFMTHLVSASDAEDSHTSSDWEFLNN